MGEGDTGEQWLLFEVDSEGKTPLLGLPVAEVWSVTEELQWSPVPLVPGWFLGLMNHQGRVVNVVDPCPLLDMPSQQHQGGSVVVLVPDESASGRLGLWVSGVREVASDVDFAAAEVPSGAGIKKVVKHGEELLSLLSGQAIRAAVDSARHALEQRFVGGLSNE